MMRKRRKYIWIVIAGFVLFILLLPLLTQTAFFKERAKIQVIKWVESQVNLKLDIEKLNGNFLNHLTLENVRFSDADSIVAPTFQLCNSTTNFYRFINERLK